MTLFNEITSDIHTIYIREVFAQIQELETMQRVLAESLDDEALIYLQTLKTLLRDLEGTSFDLEFDGKHYPESLICESGFPAYCRDYVEDNLMPHMLDDLIRRNIDWQGVVFDKHQTCGKVVFRGTIFYYEVG